MAMMAPDGSTSYAQGMGGMMGASPGSPLMMPGSPPMAMMGQMNPAMMMGLMPGQPHGMGHQMMMGHQLMGGGGFQDQLGVVQMQMPPMSQIHSQLQSHAAAYGMQAAAQPQQYGAQPPQYGSQPPSADPSASYGAGPSGWGEAEAAPRMSDPPQSSPYAPWGGGGGGGGPSSFNGGGQYATAGIERGMAGASLDGGGGGGGGAGTWDRLYVTGFPREITEMDIQGLFAPFGEITEVKLVLRPDGLFRGAATVAFATAAQGYAASQALASYVPQGHNRPIVIKPSRPKGSSPRNSYAEANSAYAPAAGSYAGAACGACGGAPPTSSAPPTAAPGACDDGAAASRISDPQAAEAPA